VVDALDLHLLVLGSPSAQLAFDVAVVSRETTETGRVDVDVVQLGERLGEVITDDLARRHVERGFGLGPVAQDRAVDGMPRGKSAEMTVCSRTMSCAVGRT
jgi:hypothetical protein